MRFLVALSLSALVVILPLGKNHKQAAENANHIVEQIQRVANEIVAAQAVLLHDHVRVEQDEPGHHDQPEVEGNLKGKGIEVYILLATGFLEL